jgi:geranylgeranyl reductase family protein
MQKKIIIIGGGPAGLYLAYKLAKNAVDVTVLEKYKWPRYKPCGGALSEKSINLLSEEKIYLNNNLIKSKINKFKFRFDFKESFNINYKGKAVKLINREKFDDYLKNIAVEMGAEFKDQAEVKSIYKKGKKVILNTPKSSYNADIIVGADGANSITAKCFNAYHDSFLKYRGAGLEAEIFNENLKLLKNDEIIVDFGQIKNGYSWAFPKNNQTSIGLGNLRYNKINLKEKLYNYLNKLEIDYNKNNIFFKGHLIPAYSKKFKIKRSGENYLLVGDAAYLADAFIGEGIYFALLSAEIAAEAIIDHFNNKKYSLQNYELQLQKQVLHELESAEKLALIFYNSNLLIKKVIRKRPDLIKEFIDVVQGESSYSEFLNLFNFFKKILKL